MWTLCFASCVVWKRCDEPVSDGKGCQSLPVDRYTDMRCGFPSLALLVQGILKHPAGTSSVASGAAALIW